MSHMPLTPAEEIAHGIYDAPCQCCGEVGPAESYDRAGHCPECVSAYQAEIDAEDAADPTSPTYAELAAHYDDTRVDLAEYA